MDPVTGGAVVDHSMQTSIPGLFACGNVLHVHDLVDSAALEAKRAGASAWEFTRGEDKEEEATVPVEPGENVRYVVPHRLRTGEGPVELKLRVERPGRDRMLVVEQGGQLVASRKVHRAVPSEMILFQFPGDLRAGAPLKVKVTGGGTG
jgi:hypothetical protein